MAAGQYNQTGKTYNDATLQYNNTLNPWQYNQTGKTYNDLSLTYWEMTSVSPDVTVSPSALSLLLSQQSPTISVGGGVTVSVAALALAFSLLDPTTSLTRAVTVYPELAQIFLSSPLAVAIATQNINLSIAPKMADVSMRMKGIMERLSIKGKAERTPIPRFRSYKDL